MFLQSPRRRADSLYARRLTRDLIGYWSLEEASGNRFDRSGNGLTLTDNNTVTGNPGPSGKLPLASQFTAANSEYLSRADDALLSMGAGVRFSISLWFYKNSSPANAMCPFAKWTAVGGNKGYFNYWDNADNRFHFACADGITTGIATANTFGAPSNGVWYHQGVYYDGVNVGIAINNGPFDTAAYTADVPDETQAFNVGRNPDVAGQFWNGRMAALTLWKRVLTAQEWSYLYNRGNGRSFAPSRGFV